MLLLSLALKLGFHPSTLARLSTISSNFQKQTHGGLLLVFDCYKMLSIFFWRDGKLGFDSPFFRGMQNRRCKTLRDTRDHGGVCGSLVVAPSRFLISKWLQLAF